MAFSAKLSISVMLLAVVAGAVTAEAKTFKVGDSDGWTILRNKNYSAWAAGQDFAVGDELLFVYNRDYHSVLEVNQADFEGCVRSSPLSEYSSGNDTIPLASADHHYFICGKAGHCGDGQKLDVFVAKPGSSGGPSASPSVASGNL